MLKTINIKFIRIDGGTQSRVRIDMDIVTEYADSIKAKHVFPPLIVFDDGAERWLADGFHRWHALNKAGKTSADVDMRSGTRRDAFLFSLGANTTHGMRRSNEDKRMSVESALNDAELAILSDRQIAEICVVSNHLVSTIKGERVGEFPLSEKNSEQNQRSDPELLKKEAGEKSAEKTGNKKRVFDPEFKDDQDAGEAPDDYTELDAAHDQIHDLQAALAVAETAPPDRDAAATLIAELRAHIKALEAELSAVKASRDSYLVENQELKKQCAGQRKMLEKLSK